MIQKIIRNIIILLIVIFLVFFLFMKLNVNHISNKKLEYKPNFWGVTFSRKFSEEIGLDWKEVYLAMLDDLKVKEVRIPIYWDDIETKDGQYYFSDYDYIFNEGKKRNVNFIANIGWRLPRWPECHTPKWAGDDVEKNRERVLEMIRTIVDRYKDNDSIKYWQIENEPFFNAFGECPPSDEKFLHREIALVRMLDDRPIILTATGELSWWNKEAKLADIFGSTLYRIVYGPLTGYIKYPIPPVFYRFKADLLHIPKDKRFIIELQAEPWSGKKKITDLSEKEIHKSFSINQFKDNLQYAINVDFEKTYLWGVEWWYWQRKHGNIKYWNLAKTLFK